MILLEHNGLMTLVLTIYGANNSEMKTIALNDDFTVVMYDAMSANYVKVFELMTSSINENYS